MRPTAAITGTVTVVFFLTAYLFASVCQAWTQPTNQPFPPRITLHALISSYTPNSGSADACLDPQTTTCHNVVLLADYHNRRQFDDKVPRLVGKEIRVTGYYVTPTQFVCTSVPSLARK